MRFGAVTGQWRHSLDQGYLLVVAIGDAGLVVYLCSRARWHRWLRHLAPVGRMALSNYLGHTVVGIAVFYGIGLGIGPRYGTVAVVCTFVVLFCAQIASRRWCLDRFRLVPAQVPWRALPYDTRHTPHLHPVGVAKTEH